MRIGLLVVAGLLAAGCASATVQRVPGDGGGTDADTTQQDSGPDPALCGNGVLDPGEACDDGNNIGGDGCSADCQSEDCSPATCAGCCDASNVCRGGTQDETCGAGGAACEDCTQTAMACLSNVCQQLGSCTPGETLDCGNCGTMTCDNQGTYGPCLGEGTCAENQLESGGSCGNCGTQERTCTSSCQWGAWTCVGEGSCAPGQIDTGSSCGNCGTQERTCTSSCQWGAWTCVGEGSCAPGQIDTGGSCGNCGTQERTCTSSCQWGAWTCVGEGPCSPGQTQTGGTCGGTGTEERTCNSNCQWGAWICIGGCPVSGHMGTGENGDSCAGVPAESWRCVFSNYWGTWISQVCRSGNWLTCELNPPNCAGCCGSWSSACGDCV